MRLWRLSRPEFLHDPPGEGARLFGGRWNSPGEACVYCSVSLAMSVLEVWVHLVPEDRQAMSLPKMMKIGFDLPDDVVVERDNPTAAQLHDPAHTRAFGDRWLAEGRSLALSVPSAIIPEDSNILLNPRHPDFARAAVVVQAPFQFDERLAV